jgi:hypothetical protein
VCASSLLVRQFDLEGRIVGAIRDRVLTPENVAYAVDRAVEIIRSRCQPNDHGTIRSRLSELETQLERAVDLAVVTRRVAAVKQRSPR